jgi:DNA primase
LLARSIPEEVIQRIKNSANIVDVIGETVVLKKAGRNYQGLCPFHAEKTPSFSVSPEKQIFYCFGCHTGGNAISYLMQHDGLSFPEAIRALAAKYGIEVPEERLSPAEKARMSEREQLLQINESALAYFRRTLRDSQLGQRAMAYLLGRGMTRKIIDGYGLGYAPDQWDGLLRAFRQQRLSPELVVKAGLVIPRKDRSGHYDRFRNRVMFPIFNDSRQVIGFGGRVMNADLPKYLNSPETPLYNKSRSLYGIDRARSAARKSGRVYVVEGYFDVLAMHLYGFENTVATLGTALTAEHVQLLKGMIGSQGHIILVYDSDQAGINAARRSISIFEAGFVDARILILPKGYDPDAFLREKRPGDFTAQTEKAAGIIPFLLEIAIQEHGSGLEGRVKTVAALQEPLAAIQDSVARGLYIKQMAERLNIDETTIMERIRDIVKSGGNARADRDRKQGAVSEQRLDHQILAMMLGYPAVIPEIVNRNLLEAFQDAELQAIARMIAEHSANENQNAADLIMMIKDPRQRNLMTRLAISEDHWDHEGCARVLAQFEGRHHRRMTEVLQQRIIAAEKDNDIDLLGRLLREKQKQAGKGLTN